MTEHLDAFKNRSMQDVGAALPQTEASSDRPVSLRIFAGDAMVSPGSTYKAIMATTGTSTREVIERALAKYEFSGDTDAFELHFARIDDKGKLVKKGSLSKLLGSGTDTQLRIVLEDDVKPVLVAEWYSSEPRRFELARKKPTSMASPEKGTVKRGGSLLSFRRRGRDAKPNAFMAVANAKSEPASPSKQASSESMTRSPPQSPHPNGQASTSTLASPGPSGVTKRPSARFQSTL
eukprot:m.10686 g.10686  ORF g.10686 m.10686 type:complete len:235 (-) comp9656_c0_seq1:96-800(-)